MQNLTLLLTQAIINAPLVTNSTDIEAICRGIECKINHSGKALTSLAGLKNQVSY